MCQFKKKKKKTEICDSTQVPGLNIWFYGVPFSTLGNTGRRVGLGESYRVWSWMCWVESTVGVQVGWPWLEFVAMTRHPWQRNWMIGYCRGWAPGQRVGWPQRWRKLGEGVLQELQEDHTSTTGIKCWYPGRKPWDHSINSQSKQKTNKNSSDI